MALHLRRAIFLLAIMAAFALTAPTSHATTRSIVHFDGFKAGTVVVRTHERRLYYVLRRGHALRFSVGVGRAGMQWSGITRVSGKYVEPAWRAPASINHGVLGRVIPGGSPRNPMGVAALTLQGGEYAIHGTNNPGSIGRFVSHGCIRMYNADIKRLFRLVSVGTRVVVQR